MNLKNLQSCQVETPHNVVDLAWTFASKLRPDGRFSRVIDLGAGDARFSKANTLFDHYLGIELDSTKASGLKLPKNASVIIADVMDWNEENYDLCIGNPPYIRHHKIDSEWREKTLLSIKERSGVSLKKTANLFVIFLMEALLRTSETGAVVQIIPFEWVSRPSSREVREFIIKKGWTVSAFRFNVDIFPSVLTTASLTIIDKQNSDGKWKFGDIDIKGNISYRTEPSESDSKVLAYQGRSEKMHALRGLSPGGQEIFVLTEEERLHFSLQKKIDVVPCVTTLRSLPIEAQEIDAIFFDKYFVDAGKRCWLIRSDLDFLSPELSDYLTSVGEKWKKYSTCTVRKIWSRYRPHPSPDLFVASGFVGNTPKIFINSVEAIAVGSVYGVFSENGKAPEEIAKKLRMIDFGKNIVSHSNNLKKIEVRQLNTILDQLQCKA